MRSKWPLRSPFSNRKKRERDKRKPPKTKFVFYGTNLSHKISTYKRKDSEREKRSREEKDSDKKK